MDGDVAPALARHDPAIAYGVMLFALGLLAASAGGTIGLMLIGVAQAGMNMAIWAMLALSVRHGASGGLAPEALRSACSSPC